MEFNVEELMNQRKEEILKSGEYVRCEIIVGCDDDVPYMQLEATGVSLKEMMKLLVCIKTIKDSVYEKHPYLKLVDKIVDESDIDAISYDASKKEEEVCADDETV